MIGSTPAWICGLVVAVVLLTGSVHAQAVARSFGELSGLVEVGQLVVVTDDTGRKTKGRIADLSAASLVLLERDALGTSRSTTIDAARVTRIRRTDSLWNGILIGAGIGAGVTMGAVRSRCGGHDRECSANFGGAMGFALIPAFAGAGALVDWMTGNRLVYSAAFPRRGASVAVSPQIGRREAGVSVSMRF